MKTRIEDIEEQLHTVTTTLQGAMVGLWTLVIDAQGRRYLEADETMCKLLGMSADTEPQEAVHFLMKRIVSEDAEKFMDYERRLVEEGRAEVLYRWMHPTKGVVYFRCSGWLKEDDLHQKVICGFHQDVTALKQALLFEENERLQKKNERVNTQLEIVMSGIRGGYTVNEDEPGYPYRYVSSGVIKNQGFSSVGEFLAATKNSGLNNILPADRDTFSAALEKQLAQGDTYSVKYRVLCKDGSCRWIMDSGKRYVDERGKRVISCLMLDINNYETVNRMYQHERLQYQEALTSDSEYAFTVDLTAGLLENGYSRQPEHAVEAVRGKSYPISIDDELRSAWKRFQTVATNEKVSEGLTAETALQAFESGTRNCEAEYYDATRQKYLRVTILMSRRPEDGHVIGIIIGRDITVYKQEQEQHRKVLEETNRKLRVAYAEAEAANAAKTDFLARMSHDIRTPLNAILGLLEISKRFAGDPKRLEECRQQAVESANHLLALLNDVLDMSKMESGRFELDEEAFDMNEMIHQTQELIEHQTVQKNIRLFMNTQEPLKYPRVIGSPLHVRQVLTNLLSNAVKYNKENGYIAVDVEERELDAAHVEIKFTISDGGIGMSKEFLTDIYEPFAREKNNIWEDMPGTGLGMAIVKKIVDKMGGSIEVRSKVGEGSTFIVTLPFVRDLQQERAAAENLEKKLDLKGLRVLLVEDNRLNREIAQCLLTDEGAQVELAYDGQQAIDEFENHGMNYYDVILMDMMMPVLDGCSAVRLLRALKRPDAVKIPIIALTANAFFDDVRKCMDAGMNAHLAKPLNIRNAVKLIRKYTG